MDVKFKADTKMADSKRELELQKASFNQEVNARVGTECFVCTYRLSVYSSNKNTCYYTVSYTALTKLMAVPKKCQSVLNHMVCNQFA